MEKFNTQSHHRNSPIETLKSGAMRVAKQVILVSGVLIGVEEGGHPASSLANSVEEAGAYAEAKTSIEECRDSVLCTLGKISLEKGETFLENEENYQPSKHIDLGGHEADLVQYPEGYALIIGETVFRVGNTLQEANQAIAKVQAELNHRKKGVKPQVLSSL